MTKAIEKVLNVPLRPKDAFKLFTEHLADWWPTESHSLSASDGDIPSDIEVEPRVGGRITETKPSGEKGHWGTITRWEPGRAFGLEWYVGRPQDQATDLIVIFCPTDTGTRIELTHSGFERLAETQTMLSNYDAGWTLVLMDRFNAFAQKSLSEGRVITVS